MTLASSVIVVPSRSEMTIVRGANTNPASGRSPPIRVHRLCDPDPSEQPDQGGQQPDHQALITTERMTCLREAPSVRSVANSRVRWATVIDRC